ncbi:MAG: PUR family DNA/RNA-binding protein [Bacteroidales bacterium]|nr:PUR family DNA/RNA-binding protein [Bacteroidales bacterium]
MEEEAGIKEEIISHDEKAVKEEIFTRVVRAGKRTYFFDVKATRKDDYYLTITESKKRLGNEGKVFYEKHKIFLYKEDFEKFAEGLKDAVGYIENGRIESAPVAENVSREHSEKKAVVAAEEYTNVEFEDLGKNS